MMTNNTRLIGKAMHSRISSEGELKLTLETIELPEPSADEVIVRVEAAPINPSDRLLMFAPADPATLTVCEGARHPTITGRVPAERLPALEGRLDQSLPVGNEGAGTVIRAGANATALLGRTVATRDAMFAQFKLAKAVDCLVLPEGITARDGAAASINPMTALGMVETMRREGHRAIVHTAAASSLGQMLIRLCKADNIPLVSIVRRQEQVDLLRSYDAEYVLDSSSPSFEAELIEALAATGATLAFDAIGGGRMAATIIACMEVALMRGRPFNRYGSPVHKQVYTYGVLNPGPKIIEGNLGMAWGIGGWLMTWFLNRIGAEATSALKRRVAAEITTTFASTYAAEISLPEALSLDVIASYARSATGGKYLIIPNAD
jgi:NADPH2:quinone reductase